MFLSKSVSAVVGAFDPAIQLVAEGEGIPYLVTSEHEQHVFQDRKYTFFMLPEKEDVNRAVLDVVDAFQWSDSAVIYDSTDGKFLLSIFFFQENGCVFRVSIHPLKWFSLVNQAGPATVIGWK